MIVAGRCTDMTIQDSDTNSLQHEAKNNDFRTALVTDLDKPAPTLIARYYKDGKNYMMPDPSANRPPRILTPNECRNLIPVEVVCRIAQQLITYFYT